MPNVVKLTRVNRTTKNNTTWKVGQTNKLPYFGGYLCSDGCLHAYRSLSIAKFASPIHCPSYTRALLCSTPEVLLDDGLKIGCQELTGVRWIKLPKPSLQQRFEWAARCLMLDTTDATYRKWLFKIISNTDCQEESIHINQAESGYTSYGYLSYARVQIYKGHSIYRMPLHELHQYITNSVSYMLRLYTGTAEGKQKLLTETNRIAMFVMGEKELV